MPLTEYEWGNGLHDITITGWWGRLVELKEAEFYSSALMALSSTFQFFQPPMQLLYAEREGVIWFVAWCRPTFDLVGTVELWLAPEMRATKEGLAAVIEALMEFTQRFSTLLVYTTSERISAEHQHFGFQPFGELVINPSTGETSYISTLTREQLAAAATRLQPKEHAHG